MTRDDGEDQAQPLVAYTDGSGTTADKVCGAGVVVYRGGEVILEASRHLGPGTNNHAELSAIRVALAITDATGLRDRDLVIRSDSEYAIWCATSSAEPSPSAKNAKLIALVRAAMRGRRVRVEWVKGHAGDPGNERADALAGLARLRCTGATEHMLVDRDGVARNARALTIHQPWASLVAQGIKRVENRTWSPPPEELGPGDYLLLHAGKTFDLDAWQGALEIADHVGVSVPWLEEMRRPLATVRSIANRTLRATASRGAEARARELVPFSAIVGVARYVGGLEHGDIAAAGRWYVGPLGWALDEATVIEPVPLNGAQGLFRVEPSVYALVRARWHEAVLG